MSTRDEAPPYRTPYLKLRSVLYDRATGLPAFPVLFDRLRTALDERRSVGVLHLELADLALVESLYGWQVFDGIVARVASTLRDAIGAELPPGALLALSGVAGDRFVTFLPTSHDGGVADAAWLARVAEDLRRRVDRALETEELAGLGPRIRARVGHALLSTSPFYRLERRVYAAIGAAREGSEQRERRGERAWAEQLHEIIGSAAVETRFQPILELEGGALLGHEACARGPSDTLFESPRTLFALSERVGLAADLDRLCCDRAIAAFGRGPHGGGKLFVNALVESFDDEGRRAERLQATLAELALDPSDLVLEFSERRAEPDADPFCQRLGSLKQRGFAIAIDDVGTGSTSQATLERLRPDYLKLDASLVRGIDDNLIQQDLLATLARLASRVGAAVIAEGVETRSEAECVARGGARYAQGYFFGRPSACRTRSRT
jgi:EAL domain-containing protein (putative c-di-GMP-specific phosphodiesterase class I)/GGDEF domain-containing protein